MFVNFGLTLTLNPEGVRAKGQPSALTLTLTLTLTLNPQPFLGAAGGH